MAAILRVSGVCLVALCGLLCLPARAQEADLTLLKAAENVFVQRIKSAEPSVVSIACVRTQATPDPDFFRPQNRPPLREEDLLSSKLIPNHFGAGVIIRENG